MCLQAKLPSSTRAGGKGKQVAGRAGATESTKSEPAAAVLLAAQPQSGCFPPILPPGAPQLRWKIPLGQAVVLAFCLAKPLSDLATLL